jgi:hypothetical protein
LLVLELSAVAGSWPTQIRAEIDTTKENVELRAVAVLTKTNKRDKTPEFADNTHFIL